MLGGMAVGEWTPLGSEALAALLHDAAVGRDPADGRVFRAPKGAGTSAL